MDEYSYIDTPEALEEACAFLKTQPVVAMDTEFCRTKTYWPELCLVQIAAGGRVFLIDPFPIAVEDSGPLMALLRDASVLKILHSARQDIEAFLHKYGVMPTPVYDTQIMAMAVIGNEQTAYSNLVQNYLGVTLSKAERNSDWRERPLSEAQLTYAANDVIYLLGVYESLKNCLAEMGRSDWIDDEIAYLRDPMSYRPNSQQGWRRLSTHNLTTEQKAVLRALVYWREEKAIEQNVPRGHVICDHILQELARATHSERNLQKLIKRRVPNEYKQDLLVMLQEISVTTMAAHAVSDVERLPIDLQTRTIIQIMMALFRLRCGELGIPARLLGQREEVEDLILVPDGLSKNPLMQGWRYEAFGRDAIYFLQNKNYLKIKDMKVLFPLDDSEEKVYNKV